jgi:transposase-like protein
MARKSYLSEGKKNIITALIQEYDIQNAQDIQEALKDLLGGTLKEMLEAEMTNHLGYKEYERSENKNSRNDIKTKRVRSKCGEFEIDTPQDRDSSFEPKLVNKKKKDIYGIEDKIIAMYARGLSTRQISEQIEDIYGFDVSEGFVSDVTDRLLPQIEEWQQRPLCEIYPIVFIDALYYSVKTDGIIKKLAVYVVLGINMEGHKEVLGLYVGGNESSKYWLFVLNELKNRGVRDIFVICADGLTGIKESIESAFCKAEYQRCIVHLVRNTLKYVSDKNKRELANDLRTIYHALNEESALSRLTNVTKKWKEEYPSAMKSWEKNWDSIIPIFKFSDTVRKIIYTTNAIESLNSTYRRLNRSRSVFPSETALMKALYLATLEATKKWTMPLRDWGKVWGELEIMYEGRIPE